jgi:hypothetical protein
MQVQNLFPNSGSNGSNKDGKYSFAPKANLHLTLKTKRTSAYLMEFDRSSQVFRQDVFAGFFFFPERWSFYLYPFYSRILIIITLDGSTFRRMLGAYLNSSTGFLTCFVRLPFNSNYFRSHRKCITL